LARTPQSCNGAWVLIEMRLNAGQKNAAPVRRGD
jgi:hypothetical protein